MIKGKINSIINMAKTEIILIEYQKDNRQFYCYSMRNHETVNSIKEGDTVMFEEELDGLGPVAVSLSKVE